VTDLTEGTKLDEDKVPVDLLSPLWLLATSQVLDFGAKKYEPYNWAKGISYSRVYAALNRHLMAWWVGEDEDEETGIHHLAHASCCLMFLTHYELVGGRYREYDDREHGIFDPNQASPKERNTSEELSRARGLSGEDPEPTVTPESRDAYLPVDPEVRAFADRVTERQGR